MENISEAMADRKAFFETLRNYISNHKLWAPFANSTENQEFLASDMEVLRLFKNNLHNLKEYHPKRKEQIEVILNQWSKGKVGLTNLQKKKLRIQKRKGVKPAETSNTVKAESGEEEEEEEEK
jgi:hypothetical protein